MRNKACILVLLVMIAVPVMSNYIVDYEEQIATNNVHRNRDSMITLEESIPSEDGWLNGWDFRKPHNITGFSGAGINYQIRINVEYGSGTDSGNTVYLNSRCRDDFGDVRFTDDDGVTELDYWIEEYSSGDDAVFWVEVADNLDLNQTIFIYYGNPGATTTSDGEATFIAWDDFDTGYSSGDSLKSSRGWNVNGGDGSPGEILEVNNNPTGRSGMGLKYFEDGAGDNLIYPYNEFPATDDIVFHIWVYIEIREYQVARFDIRNNIGEGPSATVTINRNMPDWDYHWYSSSTNQHDTNLNPGIGTWAEVELYLDNGGAVSEMYLDGIQASSFENRLMDVDGWNYSRILHYDTGRYYEDGAYYDDFYIRKWTDNAEPSHSEWGSEEHNYWLHGWNHRKAHEIMGSVGAGRNYQIKLTAHYDSGTDDGSHVYLNGNCMTDFEDIRFTDDDGSTLLDYWMEEYTEGSNATFWVKIADNLDSNQTIYIYYGNNVASRASNGTETFLFFDDYENQNLAAWDEIIGACTIDDTETRHGNYSLMLYDSPGPKIYANFTDSGEPVQHDFMLHNWVRDDNQLRGGHAPVVHSLQEGTKWPLRGYEDQFQYYDGSYRSWPQNSSGGSGKWFELELGISYTSNKFLAWKDGYFMGQIDLIANNGNSIPDDIYHFGYSQQSFYRTWYDDTYVRKWVAEEPKHGSWDSEIGSSTPEIEAHDDVNYEAGVSGNWINWSVQDTDPDSYEVYRDGELVESGEWLGSNIPVSVDGLSPDTYLYLLVVYDSSGNSASDEVVVSVTDSTAPLVDSPSDILYEAGTAGHWINWTPSDPLPSFYEVHREGSLVKSGIWTGSNILVSIDNLDPGIYNYTLTVNDTSGNSADDSVLVEVQDTTSPAINAPSDMSYELGSSGNSIEWDLADIYPGKYWIYLQEELVSSGNWTAGMLEYDVDYLDLGQYNFTIIVEDEYDNSKSDSVIVTVVDTTPPTLNHPSDIQIEHGTTGTIIEWNPYDLKPDSYEIYMNGTIVSSGRWNGTAIEYAIPDDLAVGSYNFTVLAYDTSGNFASDTVIVEILGTPAPSPLDMISLVITIGSITVIIVISGLICRSRSGNNSSTLGYYDS